MSKNSDIVQKLWNLCNILRDDGVHYSAYVTELTYLLFLKMPEETPNGNRFIPEEYRWPTLAKEEVTILFSHYRLLLHKLDESRPGLKPQ